MGRAQKAFDVKEDETDKKVILIEEYDVLLDGGKLTPLGIWYIRNLDQVRVFEIILPHGVLFRGGQRKKSERSCLNSFT